MLQLLSIEKKLIPITIVNVITEILGVKFSSKGLLVARISRLSYQKSGKNMKSLLPLFSYEDDDDTLQLK